MSAFAHPKVESEEAGMKYFLLGAYAGGFVLYGVALTFAATTTTNLAAIVAAIQGGSANILLATIGAAFILVGLGFKVSAVPFHMWTPDVYEGAPSSVTGFMSVTAKAAGFAALLRIFTIAYPDLAVELSPVIWALAALTMLLGNLIAIAQSSIKRMLAYSSIAHAGYVLMALVTYAAPGLSGDSVASALFYLVAYAFTTLGAWAVVVAMEKAEGRGLALDDYAGLGNRYPLLALCMTIFMLSFTGIPPTLGFVGKFYLFRTAIAGDQVWLAIIGVLTSLISAYYYLRVVVIMYMRKGDAEPSREMWLNLVVASSAVLVVGLSLYATPLFTWATQAILK
jgi:NADH-quinone oxidoreductase subunit N